MLTTTTSVVYSVIIAPAAQLLGGQEFLMARLFGSRLRVALLSLVLLAALDAARSWNARAGYARPTSQWHPSPAVAVPLAWPPGADLPASAPPGRRLFVRHCAVCHGPEGRGNGPAAPSLIPRPRDFTSGELRYRTTGPDEPPAEEDLERTVREGLHASAMPAFGDLLSADELRAVVAEVRRLAGETGPAPAPRSLSPRPPVDAAAVARGRELYALLGCLKCHGADGREWKLFEDGAGHPVRNRDLTAPWTFRGGSAPEDVHRRIELGAGPMPSYAASTTAAQRWDLAAFVGSLARIPPWEPGGKLEGPGRSADPVARGDYLVHLEMCGLCHTQIDPTGIYREDAYLAGGMRVGAWPHGVYVSRNLTGDPETGLGARTPEAIAGALRDGRGFGRELDPLLMPWPFFHGFDEADALAVGSFLRSQPPVKNAIPPPLHFGVAETVVGKLSLPLPAAPPPALTYTEGNFGEEGGRASSREGALAVTQWVVLLAGLGAVLRAGWLGRPPGRRFRPVRLALGLSSLLLVFFAVNVLFALPALPQIPRDAVAAGVGAGLPPVDAAKLRGPEATAMALRGRYLYAAACMLCHGANGSGGAKISWRPMGTLFARNLTADPETGLGRWTDAEIARAIRSGISRGGRPLHWQGMVWDHAGNLDEEDLRSLVAFLRLFPAVRRELPASFAPSPADCETYTFFAKPVRTPRAGCTPDS
jgi:mono/diheme cytochrome c family protein